MVQAKLVKGAALWETVTILIDGKNVGDEDSLALGKWDGSPCLGSRYDRRDGQKTEIGFPYSFSHASWFVLPNWMHTAVLSAALSSGQITPQQFQEAVKFLEESLNDHYAGGAKP